MQVPVVTVQGIGAEWVELLWSAAHGAEQYRVTYERAGGDLQSGHCPQQSQSSVLVLDATTTRATISGLEEYSSYFVTVTATRGQDSSVSSGKLYFMTLSAGKH